jgi:hypothetical protein
MDYSTFFAWSRRPGAVDDLDSISAAHSAAPAVFVYVNTKETNGTISSTKDATPKLGRLHQHATLIRKKVKKREEAYLVYAARFFSVHSSFCLEFHPFNWKYRSWASGPILLPCSTM